MRVVILFILSIVFVCCSQDPQTAGLVYTGRANLKVKLHQFTAVAEDSGKSIILTMTGPRELTFNINDKVSHINYETDEIVIRPEENSPEWTVKKVEEGFQLEDGSSLDFGNCKGWTMCLFDRQTGEPILKGRYLLNGDRVALTLWISESEKHVELLGLMANALFNRSRNAHQSIQSALETLSAQVWTY